MRFVFYHKYFSNSQNTIKLQNAQTEQFLPFFKVYFFFSFRFATPYIYTRTETAKSSHAMNI